MAEYTIRLVKPIRREIDAVRAQFLDIRHHARGGVHPKLTFTVLANEPNRVRFQQETSLWGIKQVDEIDAVRNADGSIDYHFVSGMNAGSRIHFDFRRDGEGTVVDATAYLQLTGWKQLIAGPFCRAFKEIGNQALEEDRMDLESRRHRRAA